MASRVIRPVDRRVIDLTGLAAGSTVTTIYLARRMDLSAYKEVVAYIRLHPGTSVANTPQTSAIVLAADGFTSEDPGALDTATASANYPAFQLPVLSTTIVGLVAGQMARGVMTSGFGLTSMYLEYKPHATTAGTVRYVLSVDLTCKEF